MELTLATRRQVTAKLAGRYVKATRGEKAAILDQLCQVNDWHRDHARKALRAALSGPAPPRTARESVFTYGPDVLAVLRFVWAAADGPTGKRLAPVMGLWVESVRRHGELAISDEVAAALCAMSPATIDRRLAADRAELSAKPRGSALTKPGSMLKSSIPMRTWAQWDDTAPGFVQIDLVGHDGGDNNGQFHFTLTVTDVATGWTCCRSVLGKGERRVAAALEAIRVGLPFHLAGIHSDNGSEFINHHLARWSADRQVTFSRGRAGRSNDNPHVEQKNWALARQSVGYFRYDKPTELRLLNDLWAAQDVLFNLFNAQQKLATKTRHGARVTKTYDTARTPADRLLVDHPDLITDADRDRITQALADTNPVALRRRIAANQASLIELARRRGVIAQRTRRQAVYESRTKINPPPPRRAPSDESTNPARRAS